MGLKSSWQFRRIKSCRRPLVGSKSFSQPVEEDVDDRSGIERQDLAEKQTTHHRNAQRTPEFRADTGTEGEGYTRKERRQSCHHDGTETQERSFVNRLRGGEAASPFSLQSKINDHDAVLLDDTDQQNDPDDGNNPEILPEEHECQQRADSGRRKRGED